MKIMIEIKGENQFQIQDFYMQLRTYCKNKALREKLKITLKRK